MYKVEYVLECFDSAISQANKGKNKIESALRIINDEINKVDQETKDFLCRMEKYWRSSLLSIKISQKEPLAKRAMISEDYITAFDIFNEMMKLQKQKFLYVEEVGLEEVYIRIAKGNYLAMSANVNQAMIGITTKNIAAKIFDFDLSKDLLGHFLHSLELSYSSYKANPEWSSYRKGSEIIRTNIRSLLTENKDKWFEYLTEIDNNQYLQSIMQQVDNECYKEEKLRMELEQDKTKRFLITGLFWVSTALSFFFSLIYLASSDIIWYKFLSILFIFPIIFTIVGAFVLRSTDGLKEDNFMKLMKLALKINFKGLKVLSGKAESEVGA